MSLIHSNETTKLMHGLSGTRGQVNYIYSASRPQLLTQVGSESYQFNGFGELEQQGTGKTFSYNAMSELVTFSGPSDSYQYNCDENGERISKSNGSSSTISASKYFEKVGSDYFKHVYAGNRRIASESSTFVGPRYIHLDHVGSTNYVTGNTGAVVLHREYGPLGEVVQTTGTAAQVEFGYSGKYLDDETNLIYFGRGGRCQNEQ